MVEDEKYYRQFLAGDTSAYDQLLLRYGDSLVLYINASLHDFQESEDLMIEAFARIMVKKPKIKDGGFKAYLYKTARNLVIRYMSRTRKNQFFSLDDMEDALPADIRTEEHLMGEERKAVLHLCLDKISAEFREALWLVYMEGLSYAQAALVMGVSRKKIDNLVTRGKQALRGELRKKGVTNAYE